MVRRRSRRTRYGRGGWRWGTGEGWLWAGRGYTWGGRTSRDVSQITLVVLRMYFHEFDSCAMIRLIHTDSDLAACTDLPERSSSSMGYLPGSIRTPDPDAAFEEGPPWAAALSEGVRKRSAAWVFQRCRCRISGLWLYQVDLLTPFPWHLWHSQQNLGMGCKAETGSFGLCGWISC